MSFTSITHALESFLSSDLAVRNGAEEFLNAIPEKDFLGGISQYLSVLNSDEKIGELAALLLKKQYIDKDTVMEKIPDNVVLEIVRQVEESITDGRKLLYIKRACEILVKLYTLKNGLPQLMQLIAKFSQATSANLKIGLMYLIEIMCEYSFNDEDLMRYSNELSETFSKFLNDADVTVRAETLKSLAGFLCSIEELEHLKKFSGVLPTLLSKCIECIQVNEEAGLTSLGSIIDLIEVNPAFIKSIVPDLLNLFTEVISTKAMAEALRIKGLSGLVVLSSSASAAVRKCEILKTKTVPALMKMMTEVDQLSIEEWTEELDDEVLSKNDPASAAEETLAKIGYELTNKVLLPMFIPLIKEALASSQWNVQHAGLAALAQLVEGSAEAFKKDLPSIVAMIQTQQNNAHPRIQYDVLTAYSFLCLEFTPDIQNNHGNEILTSILMNIESNNLKLKYRSVSAIINFCKDLIEGQEECQVIHTFADRLLKGVSTTFEQCLVNGQQKILEETLICLSTIAVTLENEFSKYYSSFMPGLQQLIATMPATTSQQISIRVHTIESIGYLLTSVKDNAEIFNKDCEIIMNTLLSMQRDTKMDPDDQHHSPILVVYGQIAEAMNERFAVYLPAIMDRVLASARIDVGAKSTDVLGNGSTEDAENQENSRVKKVNLDLGIFGGLKAISLNTAALEQKIEAFHTLHSIAGSTKTAFLPYVEAALPVVLEHISFRNSRDISETCIRTVKCLLAACGTDDARVSAIFNAVMPTFATLLTNSISNSSADDINVLLVSITECYKCIVSATNLRADVVEQITVQAAESLKVCTELKAQVLKDFAKEDMDEETQEEFEEQYDEANLIMSGLIDFVTQTLKFFPGQENRIVNSIVPDFYSVFFKEQNSDNELNIAICLFDEFIAVCSQAIFERMYKEMAQKFLDYAKDYENNDIKQSSVFGIGAIAKRATQAQFAEFLQPALAVLSGLLTNPVYADDEDNVLVKENTIASLVKVALYQVADESVRNEILSKCLPLLPLKEDTEEAQNLHEILINIALQNNAAHASIAQLVLQTLQRVKAYATSNPKSEILKETSLAAIASI